MLGDTRLAADAGGQPLPPVTLPEGNSPIARSAADEDGPRFRGNVMDVRPQLSGQERSLSAAEASILLAVPCRINIHATLAGPFMIADSFGHYPARTVHDLIRE
jgi:hypothetical protein